MQSRYLVPIAIFVSCMLLLQNNIDKAFADYVITIKTPTGGGLGATSDCMDIATGGNIIWHNCNNVLYAINQTNNQVLANFSQTLDVNDGMLSTVTGSKMIYYDQASSQIHKYSYSPNFIVQEASITPAGCTLSGGADTMKFDELGYIWVLCTTEDKILRLNPTTMTVNFISQDLTDGAGLECDNPDTPAYTSFGFGVIHCRATNNYVLFSWFQGQGTITLLDDIADNGGAGGSEAVFIDGLHDRFTASYSGGLVVYSYNDITGIISLLQSGLGSATGYTGCSQEPYSGVNTFMACFADSGVNTLVDTFYNNDTSVVMITTNIVSGFDNSVGIGFDIQDQIWLISSSLNNQRYIELSGLRASVLNPPIPAPACQPNNSNDIDNDGLPNLTDPDTDGDGIPNTSDTDDDNDCILDSSDTSPSGNVQSDQTGTITDLGTQIFCSVGINKAACTNTDVKTNGVGLLYLTMLIILSYAFIVFIHYQAIKMINKENVQVMDAVKVNPVLLLVMLIVDVGTAFYLAWIPDLIFYSTIVTMVGLAGFGIYKQIKGGGHE